jgi:predicted transcriptional regulator
MQVSSPDDVINVMNSEEIEKLVAEIEKHILNKNVHVEHYDGQRFIELEREEQQWVEPHIQNVIKQLYEGKGWESVEFPNSLTIKFVFPRVEL